MPMGKNDLNDLQWETIKRFLPKMNRPPGKAGRPRVDLRKTINGIFWIMRTGCRWADLPSEYGSKSTAHRLYQELCQKKVWKNLFETLVIELKDKMDLADVSIDSSTREAKRGGEAIGYDGNKKNEEQRYTHQ